jgi:hypothetical protein
MDKSLNYVYVKDVPTLAAEIKRLGAYKELAADTETYVKRQYKQLGYGSALDPHTSGISLLILRPEEKSEPTSIIDLLLLSQQGYDSSHLINLLRTRAELIFANAKFDVKFLLGEFGILLRNVCCVRVLAKLIGNATGSKFGRMLGYSLKDLCRDYLGIHLSGKGEEQVSDWWARPNFEDPEDCYSQQMWLRKLSYAAGDVEYLFALRNLMRETLTNPLPKTLLIPNGSETEPFGLGMADVVKTEMETVPVVAEIEFNGLPASLEILNAIQTAIYNESKGEGELLVAASLLCQEFDLEAYPSPWSDYLMPSEASLKALNNPNKLKRLISQKIGISLDNVQASVLERLIPDFSQGGE